MIELMTVLVIVGDPVRDRGAVVPERVARQSAFASANDLLASVQLARSEAIKRNVAVTLCASADGTTCAGGGGWEQGWVVREGCARSSRPSRRFPTDTWSRRPAARLR